IEHPPGADVTALPVTGLEIVEAHSSTTAGRMQEAPIPDIDAGMVHPLATGREQHQVTGLQGIRRGLARQFAEAGGGSGQSDPGRLTEHVVDQSAAVEAGFRRAAAPAVGCTDQAEGVEQDLVMESGLGGRFDCNSGRRSRARGGGGTGPRLGRRAWWALGLQQGAAVAKAVAQWHSQPERPARSAAATGTGAYLTPRMGNALTLPRQWVEVKF